MKIIGLDIAAKTGIAYWDTRLDRSSIIVSTLHTKGSKISPEERAYNFYRPFMQFIYDQLGTTETGTWAMPDFVIIEDRPRNVYTGTHVNAALNTNLYCGTFLGILASMNLRYQMVPVATWRAAQYGHAQRGLDAKDKKALALELAELAGIQCKTHDEAEAAQLVQWGATSSIWAHKLRMEAQK